MHDSVNSPAHYSFGAIECIEAIEASMSPEAFKGALKANVIKYVWRYEQKKGSEDLRKAQWYLERLISIRLSEEAKARSIQQTAEEIIGRPISYDPDDYMASGCPDGFCPMPSVRQGPAEMFAPVHDA